MAWLRSPRATAFLCWDEQEQLPDHVDAQLSQADYRRFILEATEDGPNRTD